MKQEIWRLATAIAHAAKSPTDLSRLMRTLDDDEQRYMLLDVLRRWAEPLDDNSESKLMPMTSSSNLAADTAELETLLRRRLGWSTDRIEHWLSERFGVTERVNRMALGKFLSMLLERRGPGFFDSVHDAAIGEMSSRGPIREDVKAFGDRLADRRGSIRG